MDIIKDFKNFTISGLKTFTKVLEPTEWGSTPGLGEILETDGYGNFRWVHNNKDVNLPQDKGKALVLYYRSRKTGNRYTISLQKFVALIYHPQLNGETSTLVRDGNRSNLSKDNVMWCEPKYGRKY